MRALFDVNALIALLDSDHEAHHRARSWFAANGAEGWATCPLTENGCIRILSLPSYRGGGSTPTEAMALLDQFIALGNHEFWPDDVSVLDQFVVDRQHLQGPKQLTDVYLLALATSRGGRLVTLDGAVPLHDVPKALKENLLLI